MFWGTSPALDLQKIYFSVSEDSEDELNIMIVGGCDARHVLMTLSRRHRFTKKKINVHIVESCLELIIRQLMLISIALEKSNIVGLMDKTQLYMEIYGNTLLRPSTSNYMLSKAKHLIKCITDFDYMSRTIPNVDFHHVKYRERDYAEMLLKFWETGKTNRFDICQLWDQRVRRHLGARYDARTGAFDWDRNMRLKDVGGPTIGSQEYQHFRKTGMAFTWLDKEASRPNCTLGAGVIKSGNDYTHMGYLGDIVTGPYIAFGLDSDDKNVMKMINGRYLKRSTDITERNIMKILYELENSTDFDTDSIKNITDHDLGVSVIMQQDAKISSESDVKNPYDDLLNDAMPFNLNDVTIKFHSPTALNTYLNDVKYLNTFHIVFLSHNLVEKVSYILKIVKQKGVVILENKTFLLDMRKECIREFGDKLLNIMKTMNGEQIGNFDTLLEPHLKFHVK